MKHWMTGMTLVLGLFLAQTAQADLLSGIDVAMPINQDLMTGQDLPVAQTPEEVEALLAELDDLMNQFNGLVAEGAVFVDPPKEPVLNHPKVPYSANRVTI